MTNDKRIQEYWNKFLQETSRSADLKYYESFYFAITEPVANALLDLVLQGKKRATSSAVPAYGKEDKKPEVGSLSIVTDWDGNPRCVIETTAVTTMPFQEITWEMCRLEGEDENLASWQRGHIDFFTRDGEQTGYCFTPDMLVLFEEFEVIYS